ncbi:hypothetical protein [Sphaerochaeta globosa]|uniref:Uncharacterized protein n=1 Tax=Sphaerochaeta globosa (strain ATCC BAA-1886 / DSM 22777 / Buddy) TaxID=158189 RepID=F0RWM8_SPHGB|nr:hypothetical protein [Sphaerochaeta globosa]ADY13659.1 hypothetical protein SpiBuddy_1835 [Sphaerochaeta globosa str. Buddy]
MKLTFVIHGRGFRVPAGYEARYEKLLEQALKGDGTIKITVEPNYQQRTMKENAYFHVLCKRLAEMAGGTPEDMKEMAKAKAVSLGYPVATDEKGFPVAVKYGVKGIPSSEANVGECALLIEAVHMMAAENGYSLED